MATTDPVTAAAQRAWDKVHPNILVPLQARGVPDAQRFGIDAAREALAPVYPVAAELREWHKPIKSDWGIHCATCQSVSRGFLAWPTETDRLIYQLPTSEELQ